MRQPEEAMTAGRLLDRWRRMADVLPGARFLRHQAERAERRALRHLQQRLNQISQGPEPSRSNGQPANTSKSAGMPDEGNPASRLQHLIDASLNQNPQQAEQAFHSQLLQQLLPDEARILAALSDGGHIAVAHVDATSRLGTHSERLLSNVSRVGQEAGVILTDNVPYYISHLVSLGLVEIGPEDTKLTTKYEMIETNSLVRKLNERIENEMLMKPRLARHTARLSPAGSRLWDACQHKL